jgi:hypothetical protein
MARFVEPSVEGLAGWEQFKKRAPASVRALTERFDPWTLYRMKSTGQRVFIVAFNEGGTVMVGITEHFNLVDVNTRVGGINPDDLVECDGPGPDEKVGRTVPLEKEAEYLSGFRKRRKGR